MNAVLAAQLNNVTNVFGINLFGSGAVTDTLLQLANNDLSAVGIVPQPDSLLTSTTLAVRQLASFISKAKIKPSSFEFLLPLGSHPL